MAITLSQYPTSPNLANNNLVHEVSSDQIGQPQFQYLCDIKDDADNLIQRLKQQPNPSGYGVFDIGMILTSNVGPTDEIWKIEESTINNSCGKDFKVLFGEEYATSVSGSPTIYTGAGGAGAPTVTGSSYYFDLDGTLDPNDKVNWNWNSSSKYVEELIDDITFTHQFGLTDFPATNDIRLGEFQTISLINGNANGISPITAAAQDVYAMVVTEYDTTSSLLDTTTYYNDSNNGSGGPRSTDTQVWGQVYTSQSLSTRLIHFPVGPQNFAEIGNTLNTNTVYYICNFYAQQTDGNINTDGVWGSYRFNLADPSCGYDGVRFTWKNKYGVWDYYTFPLAETTLDGIDRQTFKQTFVNFSTANSTVAYDKSRRGKTQFINKINKNRTAETNWITQEYADVLVELFFSTNVYIQDGSEFLPIVVTNSGLVEKTNPRSQKLFKYTLEYTLANDTQNRL